ncbi:hypothetical protein MX572_19265 [Rhodococcus pyridinivorans]|uniref:hypothetical protein n=1 Tax=Rhodococcus pyridinivorans TaxID=103816 RepID=UPI0020C63931|nr:hypothetical protein [Rhodococcus pyridinivorans]UTM36633.1 hypothetical protein MX572_19265 [Rhodococcus pyridinivorans]
MTTPTTGWRIWHLTPDGYLKSIWRELRQKYTGDTITATCKICDTIPGENCECGIFFIAERQVIVRQAVRWFIPKTGTDSVSNARAVITLIEPIGQTVPGPRLFGGAKEWRSTAAKIRAIAIDPSLRGYSRQLATTYGVPVIPGLTNPVLAMLERAHQHSDAATVKMLERAITQRYNPQSLTRTLTTPSRCRTFGCHNEPSLGMDLCLQHRAGEWGAIL